MSFGSSGPNGPIIGQATVAYRRRKSPANLLGIGKNGMRNSDPLKTTKKVGGRVRVQSSPLSGKSGSFSMDSRLPEDWERDADVSFCNACSKRFTLLVRKHHCRNCGMIFCSECSQQRCKIVEKNYQTPVRVCARCHFALTSGEPEVESYSHLRPVAVDSQDSFKYQISAMEDVSQALLTENKELRGLIDHLQHIVGVQKKAIAMLQQRACPQDYPVPGMRLSVTRLGSL